MNYIVKGDVVSLARVKTEIGHKTESESVNGVLVSVNGDLAATRHHHTEIFFKLLSREINYGAIVYFLYFIHLILLFEH